MVAATGAAASNLEERHPEAIRGVVQSNDRATLRRVNPPPQSTRHHPAIGILSELVLSPSASPLISEAAELAVSSVTG
jgi:hypothetical protein